MKLSLFLLFAMLLRINASVYSQQTLLSLDKKNLTVFELFDEIRNQSEFTFLYRSDILEDFVISELRIKDKPIETILDMVLPVNGYEYEILDKTVIIRLAREKAMPLNQPLTARGKVTDRSGQPLIGVNIVIEGTSTGTITDPDGRFEIQVPSVDVNLIFSYIGYKTGRSPFEGRDLLIILEEFAEALDEVVVTALGITREAKRLGYATATVTSEEIAENRTTTTLGALQGKMSGVNISTAANGPGSTTKIRIRGQSSFDATNNPLIVVNGVPIDNSSYTSLGLNNSDGGDGLSSISPDQIQSITVLKGAAAAALYGSRAKDGVLMIVTKDRNTTKGLGIEYNVNYTTDTPLDFTDYQYEYGQGEGGVRPTAPYPTSGVWSFGEKFQPGMTQILFDGVEVPYEPVYDRIRKFYNVGKNLTNTVSLSNRGDHGGFSASLSNTDNISIVPNSDFNRKTINLGFTQNISENLNVSGNVNYSNEYNRNPAQTGGQQFSTSMSVYTLSNSMPLDLLKQYMVDENDNEFIYSRFLPRTNPYYSAYKHFENIKRDRLLGNLAIKYQLTDWLYLQGRIAQDFYTRNQDYNNPTGYQSLAAAPQGYENGYYYQINRQFRERNLDFLVGVNKRFGDFGTDITFGGNQMYRMSETNSVTVQDFIQRGLYTIDNGRLKTPGYDLMERQVNSLYGAAEFSYKTYLFLNFTARNDWFSTLSSSNRSILYPSATASFLFTEVVQGIPDWLSFGKLRLAYAQVGDDNVAPYSNALYYGINPNFFPTLTGGLVPLANISTNTIPNSNLRPLRIEETEAGIELKMFDNRVGLDITYYHKLTFDQILSAQISSASSYDAQLINVGESKNQGIEILTYLRPVNTPSFKWDLTVNFSYNVSEVLRLGLSEADTMITTGGVRQIVGQPMGQLYGYKYQRDSEGRMVFDANSGRPLRGAAQENYGGIHPKYIGGIQNSFNFKGITFSSLIDFKLGHIMYSGQNRNMWRHGLHKGTLTGREQGFVIGEGVNPNGNTNATQSPVQPFYEATHSLGIIEPFVYNAGYWKLRQLTLGYDFSKHIPGNIPVKGLRLSLVANNVAVIKKWTKNIDPEEVHYFSDNATGGLSHSLPTTRTLGFNLNVAF